MSAAKSLSARIREKKKSAKEAPAEMEPMESQDQSDEMESPEAEAEMEPMPEEGADEGKKKRMERARAKLRAKK